MTLKHAFYPKTILYFFFLECGHCIKIKNCSESLYILLSVKGAFPFPPSWKLALMWACAGGSGTALCTYSLSTDTTTNRQPCSSCTCCAWHSKKLCVAWFKCKQKKYVFLPWSSWNKYQLHSTCSEQKGEVRRTKPLWAEAHLCSMLKWH